MGPQSEKKMFRTKVSRNFDRADKKAALRRCQVWVGWLGIKSGCFACYGSKRLLSKALQKQPY